MEEQIVTFQLAGELYGVEVGRVQSIIPMQAITVVPGAPRFIEGVINLRGSVVPVIDLRTRFSLPTPSAGQKQVIVIMELGTQQMGLVVDRVTAVIRLVDGSIEPPSPLLASVETAYLRGIARLQEQVLILLDLDRVFSSEEQQALQQAG